MAAITLSGSSAVNIPTTAPGRLSSGICTTEKKCASYTNQREREREREGERERERERICTSFVVILIFFGASLTLFTVIVKDLSRNKGGLPLSVTRITKLCCAFFSKSKSAIWDTYKETESYVRCSTLKLRDSDSAKEIGTLAFRS